MSGLVFVWDYHGRPLMPMAPAYARRLLRQGRAHLRPAVPFTVIQLKDQTGTALRPIDLHIHSYTASTVLLLVLHGTRALMPVLRVIVPQPLSVLSLSKGTLFAEIVETLRTLAPISQLIFPHTVEPAAFMRDPNDPVVAGLTVSRGPVEHDFFPATAATPSPVALSVVAWHAHRYQHVQRFQGVAVPKLPVGSLVVASTPEPQLGVVARWRARYRARVMVPRLVDDWTVDWHYLMVRYPHLRLLRFAPVVFVPLPKHIVSGSCK